MMEDYDYHKNTGELSEYFDDKNARRSNRSNCSSRKRMNRKLQYNNNQGCLVLFSSLIVALAVASGCSSRNDKTSTPLKEEQTIPYYNPPAQIYTQPAEQSVDPAKEQEAISTEPEQPSQPVQQNATPTVKISKAYEEGYDKGYDDGEDDAVHHNGYKESFDDSNNYRGQKKKDFELGYEEGYEAGYDDNMERDDE